MSATAHKVHCYNTIGTIINFIYITNMQVFCGGHAQLSHHQIVIIEAKSTGLIKEVVAALEQQVSISKRSNWCNYWVTLPRKATRGQGVESWRKEEAGTGSRGSTCAEMGMGGSNYVGNESGQIVLLSLVR